MRRCKAAPSWNGTFNSFLVAAEADRSRKAVRPAALRAGRRAWGKGRAWQWRELPRGAPSRCPRGNHRRRRRPPASGAGVAAPLAAAPDAACVEEHLRNRLARRKALTDRSGGAAGERGRDCRWEPNLGGSGGWGRAAPPPPPAIAQASAAGRSRPPARPPAPRG